MCVHYLLGSVLDLPFNNIESFYNEYDDLSKLSKEQMLKSVSFNI